VIQNSSFDQIFMQTRIISTPYLGVMQILFPDMGVCSVGAKPRRIVILQTHLAMFNYTPKHGVQERVLPHNSDSAMKMVER
jgi:hypothetical protein